MSEVLRSGSYGAKANSVSVRTKELDTRESSERYTERGLRVLEAKRRSAELSLEDAKRRYNERENIVVKFLRLKRDNIEMWESRVAASQEAIDEYKDKLERQEKDTSKYQA